MASVLFTSYFKCVDISKRRDFSIQLQLPMWGVICMGLSSSHFRAYSC